MRSRKFWESYKLLNQLISQEPNTQLFRLRGICEQQMNMPDECIRDANKIIELNTSESDVKFAYSLLARSYIQLGNFSLASKNANLAGSISLINSCDALHSHLKRAKKLLKKSKFPEAKSHLDILVPNCPKSLEILNLRSQIAWNESDFTTYTNLHKLNPKLAQNNKNTYRRGISQFCNGNFIGATDDLKLIANNNNVIEKGYPSPSDVLKIIDSATQSYVAGQHAAESKDFSVSDEKYFEALNITSKICPNFSLAIQRIQLIRLKNYRILNKSQEYFTEISALIAQNPNNSDAYYLERGGYYLEMKDFEKALEDFSYLKRKYQDNSASEFYQQAVNGYGAAKQLKKRASHVNYYELLGIPPNAQNSQIKQALSAAARKWHPDRFSDKKKKREAEETMIKINKASEILLDPTKRRLYDNGVENPEDQMVDAEDADLFATVYGNLHFHYASDFTKKSKYNFDFTEPEPEQQNIVNQTETNESNTQNEDL